jgi:18S rRNA (guanine1575-N7)-methyltransferase
MSRPELTGRPELFYNTREARKYDSSSRMMGVQRDITERAIELLRLNPDGAPCLILDVGCGSGLSGKVLEEHGHVWVGCDISRDMLHVAKERMVRLKNGSTSSDDDEEGSDDDQEDEGSDEELDDANDEDNNKKTKFVSTRADRGDLLQHDMGTGLPFRAGVFDACVSVSALQWLCYGNSSQQNPKQRLARFFSSLYSVLKRGGRAVLQFYPETPEQAVLISEAATRVGFAGGVVIDYPNSAKAKKHYLVLSFDKGSKQRAAAGAASSSLTHAANATSAPPQQHVSVAAAAAAVHSKKRKPAVVRKNKGVKTKEWILHKKESQRNKGKDVRPDSKYTARRRPHKF